MGYVKTPEEITEIEHALSHPRFVNGEMLSIDFLTDPAVVAEILPPPLQPGEQPVINAMVGRWQSNCVGDFYGGALYVHARYGELAGAYVLSMWMDGDIPTIYGRDVFGEPKKLAESRLHRRGHRYHGYVERHGVRLLELEADLPEDRGPGEAEGINFNFKARPDASGIGLQEDAILTVARFQITTRVQRVGTGSLSLRGTVHDPVDELPVREVLRATYTECDLIGQCEAVASVAAETFLPFHYGRHDVWSALDTERAMLVPVG